MNRQIVSCCWSALLALACSFPAVAEERAVQATPDTIKQLIEELGADEFSTREAATEQLVRIGLPAYKSVEDAVQHPDREVKYRAERVLGRIRQSDLQRRLDAFLAGKEATDEYQLPGWKRFKSAFGDDRTARTMFVDLTKTDPELLQAIENNPRTAGETFSHRLTQYKQLAQFGGNAGGLHLGFGQIAALVFVAGEDDIKLNQTDSSLIISYCSQQAFSEGFSNPKNGEIPRKMLSRIILRTEDWAAYSAMSLARRYNMKEGLVAAEKILKGNRQPHMATMALSTIAVMGDDSYLPLVEKLLTDTALVTQMQEKDKVLRKVEVRDAALATAVFMTKQDLKSYYEIPNGQNISDPQFILTNPRIIGHTDQAKRDEVFKKWAEYRSKNPLPTVTEKKADEPAKEPAPENKLP